jgi:hypothetical protein
MAPQSRCRLNASTTSRRKTCGNRRLFREAVRRPCASPWWPPSAVLLLLGHTGKHITRYVDSNGGLVHYVDEQRAAPPAHKDVAFRGPGRRRGEQVFPSWIDLSGGPGMLHARSCGMRFFQHGRRARQTQGGIEEHDLAFLRAEYQAIVRAHERWDPVSTAIEDAIELTSRLVIETPDNEYLMLVQQDLRNAADRFGAFRSTYDRRVRLIGVAFGLEHPDAPKWPDCTFAPVWAGLWSAFYDAWERENGPAIGTEPVRDQVGRDHED